jgi:ADP-heptose:LPS heptosyltransferase
VSGQGERRPVLLVLRALGLGDLLTALPALRGLAGGFPDHHRVLAAPPALAPLALLTSAVDEVLDTAPLAPVDRRLTAADTAVNLHGRGPESHRVLLATRPGRLIAYANPEVPASRDGPPWRDDEHEVRRWCRLLAGAGIAADPDALELPWPPPRARPAVATATAKVKAQPPGAERATVVHPGAASAARRWPAERFAAVAASERRAGRRVLVTGSGAEAGLALQVAARAGLDSGGVLAGRTDLLGLAALVAGAGRVVCGDTGVAHLATALGTPSVLLFGPTSPARWGPPPDRRGHVVLWSGRTGDPHGSAPDPGLLQLTVDDVLAALRTLPRRAGRAGRAGRPAPAER